jgi:hypothetical protein
MEMNSMMRSPLSPKSAETSARATFHAVSDFQFFCVFLRSPSVPLDNGAAKMRLPPVTESKTHFSTVEQSGKKH